MYGSSKSVASRSARILSASSTRPLAMSQRGDSGSHGTVANRTNINRNWKAKGTRQDALPATKLMRVSKYYRFPELCSVREAIGDPVRQREAGNVHNHLNDD